MRHSVLFVFALLALFGCAADTAVNKSGNISAEYEELDTTTLMPSPEPVGGSYSPADRDIVDRGAYMIELLGCGSCHTNGAFDGEPDMSKALAGSDTGIAYTSPLDEKYPGVVYPPNITPDEETGIGNWSDRQVANAIRAGIGRHGDRRIVTMPWQAYSQLNDDDVGAIVAYLHTIKPIRNRVPEDVKPGRRASSPFVYFGVYRSKR